MWPGRVAGNPATNLTAVHCTSIHIFNSLEQYRNSLSSKLSLFVSGNLMSSWRDQCSDDEKPLSLHGAV